VFYRDVTTDNSVLLSDINEYGQADFIAQKLREYITGLKVA
jgi:hypothetical protein